jgi:hypothetical protein
MDLVVQMTSGVRVAFRTTSRRIELDALVTGIRLEGDARAPVVRREVDGSRGVAADRGNTIVVASRSLPGARVCARPTLVRRPRPARKRSRLAAAAAAVSFARFASSRAGVCPHAVRSAGRTTAARSATA